MDTIQLSQSGRIQDRSSEILMDDIIYDDDLTFTLIEDHHSQRTKVIPTNNPDNIHRQTIFIRNSRSTWEKEQNNTTWGNFFKRERQNRMTLKEAVEIRQRELLNDYAYEMESNTKWSKLTKWMGQKFKVIDPDSGQYILWQLLNCVLVMFFLFQIPFMLCFEMIMDDRHYSYQTQFRYILIIAIIIFSIDVLITFNTAYYGQGQLVFNRKMIAKEYVSSYLLLDILPIACLVDQISIFNREQKLLGYAQVIFVLKMYEIFKTTNMIQEYMQLNRTTLSYFRLLEVMLSIGWLCHVFACVFHKVGNYYNNNHQLSWLNQIDLFQPSTEDYHNETYENSSILKIYSYSFYWAVTTMVSVGYGDLTPRNMGEVWVTTTSMFISCIVFAFSINAIWEVINQSRESKQRFQKYVNAIERFMHDHNVNRKLKTKIEAYLFHLWQTEKTRDSEMEQAMLQKLAPALREELLYDTYGKLFHGRVFFQNFSIDFLRDLAGDIEQVSFSQGETVFLQGDEVLDFPIYCIVDGQVEIFLNTKSDKSIKLSVLKRGQSFGLVAFITGVERTASARCLTYTRVYKLSRLRFLKRLEENQLEQDTFFEIRHKILFDQNMQQVNLRCYICESRQHLAGKCDKTLYAPKIWEVILKGSKQQNERNSEFQRGRRPIYKALPHIREVQANANVIKKKNYYLNFELNSSEEDEEYSSDVDDYEEEMLDIKQMVREEKYMAQLKKNNQWLEDKEEQPEDQQQSASVNSSQDICMQSQLVLKQSFEEINHKKKAKLKMSTIKMPRRDVRTSSMASMQPLKEKKKFKKQPSVESPYQRPLRKMTTENLDPKTNHEKQMESQILIQNPTQKQVEILQKLKTAKKASPSNQALNQLIEELKQFLGQSQDAPQIQKSNESISDMDVGSDFTIDQNANYAKFFVTQNPNKVIKQFNKRQKEINKWKRTTLVKQ